MNASFRSTATVIALTAAALAAPSLAHAKRLGGGKPMQRVLVPVVLPADGERMLVFPRQEGGIHGRLDESAPYACDLAHDPALYPVLESNTEKSRIGSPRSPRTGTRAATGRTVPAGRGFPRRGAGITESRFPFRPSMQ